MRQLISTSLLSKALLLGTLSLGAAMAMAQGPMAGPGEHGGHGGRGGPGMMMMMEGGHMPHMLEAAGATEAQRAQIKQIMQAAHADLKAQREAGRKLHEQGMALFTAAVIDAAAIEAHRQQMLAQHDQMSKRMTQAMTEAAKVLTPEQRAKLAEKMKKMQARRGERGMDRGPTHKHEGAGAASPMSSPKSGN
ncbi:hypothetical protein DBR47_05485 [Paucibacter sp. KBW04]|uniref:Spy/CpxP family protein refolding chaperone n=1 Tax=Paucibacter sp. KBW04 TaxID=2153361 RepID=UPI000F56F7F7|nr:Spy/CpxP family protein refolding chaperone [Paucibacter sp. KBW04]RQO61966.1 hypothetical protein DBR47_05485 [Paucibacter sp. KBW04]